MAFMYRPQGLINGPGSGTSDSILARISNKEFIVNAAATERHRLLLENINVGRYRGGGYAGGSSYSSTHISSIDTGVREELRSLRDDFKTLSNDLNDIMNVLDKKTSQPVAIGDEACRRIASTGIAKIKKGKV
jgi:hypothetical protein